MSETIMMTLLLMAPIVLLGLLSAFMPYLTRKTECFGVTVPPAAQDDPQIRGIKRAYRNGMLALSALLIAALAFVFAGVGGDADAGGAWFGGAIGVMLLAGFGLYLKLHYAVKRVKAERGWGEQAAQVAVVSVSGRRDFVSPLWLLTFFVFIAATVIVGVLHYDSMPERVPMHYDFAGNVTSTAPKSVGMLLFAPGIELFMALMLSFAYWGIAKARRQIDASNPEQSLEQSRRFTMAWSAFIVILGVVLMAMFTCMQLSFVGLLPPSAVGWIAGIPIVLIFVGTAIMTIRYGQGGSRVRVRAAGVAKIIDRDDDRHWKLGQFYVNRDDPSLFVEKRFGIGFTLNFGRPAAWVFMAVIFAFIAGSLIFGFTMEAK